MGNVKQIGIVWMLCEEYGIDLYPAICCWLGDWRMSPSTIGIIEYGKPLQEIPWMLGLLNQNFCLYRTLVSWHEKAAWCVDDKALLTTLVIIDINGRIYDVSISVKESQQNCRRRTNVEFEGVTKKQDLQRLFPEVLQGIGTGRNQIKINVFWVGKIMDRKIYTHAPSSFWWSLTGAADIWDRQWPGYRSARRI